MTIVQWSGITRNFLSIKTTSVSGEHAFPDPQALPSPSTEIASNSTWLISSIAVLGIHDQT
jgi:hypothetical protein